MQIEPLIPEEVIELEVSSVPAYVKTVQAADWTKYIRPYTRPIKGAMQTTWDYAKWAGGGVKNVAQAFLELAGPTKERAAKIKKEVDELKTQFLIAQADHNGEKMNLLAAEIKAKDEYFQLLTGWSPWMARAFLGLGGWFAIMTGALPAGAYAAIAGAKAAGTGLAAAYGTLGFTGTAVTAATLGAIATQEEEEEEASKKRRKVVAQTPEEREAERRAKRRVSERARE